MTSARTIILEHICPALGVVVGNVMFFAPCRDVRRAVLRGNLGDLNPTPWAFMTGNCVGWVTYGFLLDNYYLYFANAPGFLVSVWLNLCAAKLQYQSHHAREMRQSLVELLQENQQTSFIESGQHATCNENDSNDATVQSHSEEEEENTVIQRAVDAGKIVVQVTSLQTPAPAPHEKLVVGIVIVWTAVITIISFASSLTRTQREYIVGFIVNFNLLFFYGAPLSTIFTVLRSKNSASIHVPTTLTNTANATFWTAYAFAVMDPFIYVPNGIGVLLGVVQIVLYFVFPRASSEDSSPPDGEEEENDLAQEHDRSSHHQHDSLGSECVEMCPEASNTDISKPNQQLNSASTCSCREIRK